MVNHDPQPGRKVRRLSRFLCRELLYDYASGILDEDRRKAVDEFLANNEEQQQELAELNLAMDYCQDLAKTSITQPLSEELKDKVSVVTELSRKISWQHWPEFMRWGTEALLISTVVAIIAISIPWDKVREMLPESQRKYILTEVAKKPAPQPEEIKTIPQAPTPEPEEELPPQTSVSGDEEEETTVATQPPPPESAPVLMAKKTGGPAEEPVAEPEPDEVETKTTKTTVVVKDIPEKKVALKGFLYRGSLSNDNLDATTPLMRTEIEKLGGEKAGDVELGWKKTENLRYFHFTLPESNYETLLKTLRYFGPVRISKEAHWRVMPEGKIRIILTVEGVSSN